MDSDEMMHQVFASAGFCRSASHTAFVASNFGETYLNPGAESRHHHFGASIGIVLGGRLERLCYAGRLSLAEGDVWLQPTLDCHSDVVAATGARILFLPAPPTCSLGGRRPDMCAEYIIDLARRDRPALLEALAKTVGGTETNSGDREWEDEVALRLQTGDERISVIAERIGLSREKLSRGFTRAYGVSPVEYRNDLRTRAALIHLIQTDETLSKIALDLGFADQAHMTRAIRRLTGRPPSYWRKYDQWSTDLWLPL